MFGQNTSIGGLAANMGVSSNSSTPPSIALSLPSTPQIPEIPVPNLNAAGYASNVPSLGLPSFDLPLPPVPKIPETSVSNLDAAGYASNVPQINFLSPSTPQMPAAIQTPNISTTPPAYLYAGLNFDNIELR
jgi:hypothetical protein